jgi:hypothetical protein
MVRFTLIGVPSSAGTHRVELEKAPLQLRRAGPVDRLLDAGLDVVDDADLPLALYRPRSTGTSSRPTCKGNHLHSHGLRHRPPTPGPGTSRWAPTPEHACRWNLVLVQATFALFMSGRLSQTGHPLRNGSGR